MQAHLDGDASLVQPSGPLQMLLHLLRVCAAEHHYLLAVNTPVQEASGSASAKALAAGNALNAHLSDATAHQPLQRVLNQRHTNKWQQHLWSLHCKRAEALQGIM